MIIEKGDPKTRANVEGIVAFVSFDENVGIEHISS